MKENGLMVEDMVEVSFNMLMDLITMVIFADVADVDMNDAVDDNCVSGSWSSAEAVYEPHGNVASAKCNTCSCIYPDAVLHQRKWCDKCYVHNVRGHVCVGWTTSISGSTSSKIIKCIDISY